MERMNSHDYGMYQQIINQQLNKLNIRYHREDYFQEGFVAIIVALKRYNPAKSPNIYAYLSIQVSWHLRSLLRREGRRIAREHDYCQRQINDYCPQCYPCHWHGIKNPIIREIIRELQQGQTKKIIAQNLGISERALARHLANIRQYALKHDLR